MIRLISLVIILIVLSPAGALATDNAEDIAPAATTSSVLDAATLADEIDISDLESQLSDIDKILAEQGLKISLIDMFNLISPLVFFPDQSCT